MIEPEALAKEAFMALIKAEPDFAGFQEFPDELPKEWDLYLSEAKLSRGFHKAAYRAMVQHVAALVAADCAKLARDWPAAVDGRVPLEIDKAIRARYGVKEG